MAAKLTRLTHKIAIQLHLVAESCTICILAPGGQSGNFWIHPRIRILYLYIRAASVLCVDYVNYLLFRIFRFL
jgi:hypothetical protein